MADPKKENTAKRFRLRPRLPKIRSGNLRTSDQFQKLREDISTPRHICPHDGTQMELLDVYPTDPSGEIPEGSVAGTRTGLPYLLIYRACRYCDREAES